MTAQKLRRRWLAPLIFFQVYLSATVALFFFGPWPWEVENPISLAAYLVTAQLCMGLGYLLAWPKVRPALDLDADKGRQVRIGVRFLKRAVLVSLVLLIPTSLSRTGSLLPDVYAGLQNAGEAYTENFLRLEAGNPYVVFEYLRILFSPLLLAVFPLTIVYWRSLSAGVRLASVFVIAFHLAVYISTGTNKGIADAVITLPWLMFLGVSSGALVIRIPKWALAVGVATLFFAFLQFFGIGQAQRQGGEGVAGVFNTGFGLLDTDAGHAISSLLSENQRIIFESVARYVGQGYYALSLSFPIEHSSTLGLGNSMFLARNADALFGGDYFTWQSLPGLLERNSGWGMFTLWHSIYPWLASDFGFGGALVVLGVLAYMFGIAWARSLTTLAPHPVLLSYLMLILFFYIPANNQVFQSGETCIGFLLVTLALLKLKRRARTAQTTPFDASSLHLR